MKYYEIYFHNSAEQTKFIRAVNHELQLRNWGVKDLAESIGRQKSTVYDFLNDRCGSSRFVAADIANLFQLQRKEWCATDED